MWENEVSIEVAAPVEEVYGYLADFPRHKEWSRGVIDLTPRSNGAIHVGTEFTAQEVVPAKFTSTMRVTALEPPRRIAWEAWDGRVMRVQWTVELSPRGGGTHLVQRSRWRPTNLLGAVILHLMRRWQVPKENHQSLERIKAILEGAGT